MEQTSQKNAIRPLLTFIIVAAVLLLVIILGVRFAKSRSTTVATEAGHSSQQTTATPQPSDQKQASTQKANSSQPQSSAQASQPKVDGASTDKSTSSTPAPASTPAATTPAPSNPSHVPSTGVEDVLLPIGTLATVVFAAITYAQSRRRLASLT